MADNFICDGSRNSKWFFNGGRYIRILTTRKGIKTKTYTIQDILELPDSEIADVVALKAHAETVDKQ